MNNVLGGKIKVTKNTLKNVTWFKYLGKTKFRNAFSHSIRNLLSTYLLPKNSKITIYDTTILLILGVRQ
jgi:hypothetical protein